MKNCFKYGTIGEQWKQIQTERWLNPAFENFVNREIIGGRPWMPKLDLEDYNNTTKEPVAEQLV